MKLSLQDLRELISPRQEPCVSETPDDGGFIISTKVFIRTVTHYYLGEVVGITPTTIWLTDASWVADTGLFSKMLADGTIDELEPFRDPVHVSRGAIIDHTIWQHPLPKERK